MPSKRQKKKPLQRPRETPEDRDYGVPTSNNNQLHETAAQRRNTSELYQVRAPLLVVTARFTNPLIKSTYATVVYHVDADVDHHCYLLVQQMNRYLCLTFLQSLKNIDKEKGILHRIVIPKSDADVSFVVFEKDVRMRVTQSPHDIKDSGFAEFEFVFDYKSDAGWRHSRHAWNLIIRYLKKAIVSDVRYTNVPRDGPVSSVLNRPQAAVDTQSRSKERKSIPTDRAAALRHGTEGFELEKHSSLHIPVPTASGKHPWAATGMWEDEDFLEIFFRLVDGRVEEPEVENEYQVEP